MRRCSCSKILGFAVFSNLLEDALSQSGIACRYVLSTRHPIEVANSLHKRDSMPESEAVLLWLRHVLDAERATRGKQRVFISFDRLLDDWKDCLQRMETNLSIQFPNATDDIASEASTFLAPKHRHYVSKPQALRGAPHLNGWIADAYGAYDGLERDGEEEKFYDTLDQVREEIAHVNR